MTLFLASESPRRRELLGHLRIPFQIRNSGIDEDSLPGETPSETAERLAADKANAVKDHLNGGLVLAADTVIDLDGILLGKPKNRSEAFEILTQISGRDHFVVTGLALIEAHSGKSITSTVRTRVRMEKMNSTQIQNYIKSGEPMDKAGAYAIQGIGRSLVQEISGCYNNVVGLPLCEVVRALIRMGYYLPRKGQLCLMPDGSLCPRINGLEGFRQESTAGGNQFQ